MPGDKYVVVDSGGGTVDLTVHQIRLPEGHLKELYKATGETPPCSIAFPSPHHSSPPTSDFSQHHKHVEARGLWVVEGPSVCLRLESRMYLNVFQTST